MIHYEDHAYYIHEKSFIKGYKYLRIEYDDNGRKVYHIDWKDLTVLLRSPVIESLEITA